MPVAAGLLLGLCTELLGLVRLRTGLGLPQILVVGDSRPVNLNDQPQRQHAQLGRKLVEADLGHRRRGPGLARDLELANKRGRRGVGRAAYWFWWGGTAR